MTDKETTCTRCGSKNFITLCKNCDKTDKEKDALIGVMREKLKIALEYFYNRADIIFREEDSKQIPNEEMKMVTEIEEVLNSPSLQKILEIERAKDEVGEALIPVLKAIELVQPDCFKDKDWNPDFHVEITLTVKESRNIKESLDRLTQLTKE